MQIYCAPLEGVTGAAFRRAHARIFAGADRYFAPFFSPTREHVMPPRVRRELLPANNAGVALSKPFEETSLEEFERVMDTNVRAPFVVSQRALPYLRRAQGRIINIASVVAHKGYPLQSAYAASKHALLGLSKSMANELYKDGVRVHVVSPGGVYTDMAKVARPDLEPDGLITAGEIAGTVMFLLSLDKNAVVDEICLHRQGKEPFA